MPTIVQIAVKALGILLSAIGLGALIFTSLAFLDPQGAQLANDAGPFGIPPSTGQLILWLGLSAAMLLAGVWLSFRKSRR